MRPDDCREPACWSDRMAKRKVDVRKHSLHDEDDPRRELAALSPAERVLLTWELTRTAWAFRERAIAEPRLSRTAVRVLRRRG